MNSDDAENAMKHMDGGQIDGNEVAVSPVNNPKPPQMRRSPMRRGGPPNRNRWRDMRNNNRRRSPIRRSPRRRWALSMNGP
jgi:RNA-binding protein with serine-rich domain 1